MNAAIIMLLTQQQRAAAAPMGVPMEFFLGTHMPSWLGRLDVPLFVSRRTLVRRLRLPVASCRWALDSGAFTELKDHGRWTVEPRQYVEEVGRFAAGVGQMAFAAPQDWMCEPVVIKGGKIGQETFVGTGLSVKEHQRRTVENYLELCSLAPLLPWIPVLQGWEYGDYIRHVEDYDRAGINLRAEPRVGLGSVCRRQDTELVEVLIRDLCGMGIRVHAFGFKTGGLRRVAPYLASSDSMAWSFQARRERFTVGPMIGCSHPCCANCPRYALAWREKVLRLVHGAETAKQLTLW